MKQRFDYLVLIVASTFVAGMLASAEPPAAPAAPIAKAKAELHGDPYPLDTCIVSGEKLGSTGKPVVKQIDGREIRFCCKGCVKLLEDDKATYMKKLDDKIIEQQIKHYPLTHCVVMEEDELSDGEESTTYNHVHKNRLVRFCCKGCLPEFEKDPARFLAKLDAAVVKQQKEIYPLDTCPISGEKLDADAVDHVVGVTLVRFCCKDCIAKFNEDPQPVIAKLHEAWKAKHSKEKGAPHGH